VYTRRPPGGAAPDRPHKADYGFASRQPEPHVRKSVGACGTARYADERKSLARNGCSGAARLSPVVGASFRPEGRRRHTAATRRRALEFVLRRAARNRVRSSASHLCPRPSVVSVGMAGHVRQWLGPPEWVRLVRKGGGGPYDSTSCGSGSTSRSTTTTNCVRARRRARLAADRRRLDGICAYPSGAGHHCSCRLERNQATRNLPEYGALAGGKSVELGPLVEAALSERIFSSAASPRNLACIAEWRLWRPTSERVDP
jgi:hypothetical protein